MGWGKVLSLQICLPTFPIVLDFSRTSFEDVATIFGADEARSIELLPSHLRSIVGLYSHVYMDLPPSPTVSGIRSLTKQIFQRLSPPSFGHQDTDLLLESLKMSKRKPLAPEIASLRAIKSENERRVMRKAADISAVSHAKVPFCPHILSDETVYDYRLCVLLAQVFKKVHSQLISST
jgi:Xaa-Pro aminopeptidase